MTMPPDGSDHSAQILLKLGEMGATLAVIQEQLRDLPDHEQRLRALERARWPIPTIATLAAVGSAAGAWVAVIHR